MRRPPVTMLLWTSAQASIALLAATVALAAADSPTDSPTEVLIDWDYETTGLDYIELFTTAPPEEWTTRDIEPWHTTHHENIPTCPPVHLNLSLPCDDFIQCKEDGSCPEGKICCPNDCGGVECRHPVVSESLLQDDEENFTTIFTTDSPADWTTREPIHPSTIGPQYNAQCPLVHLNLSLPCGDFLQCEDDESCSEDKICCPNDCGGVECVYRVINVSLPPNGKEKKLFEPESETQILEDGPETYILSFSADQPVSCCTKLDPKGSNRCEKTCDPEKDEGIWTCVMDKICRPSLCGVWECTVASNAEERGEFQYEDGTPHPEDLYDEMPEAEVDSRTPITEWSPLCPALDLRDGLPCGATCSPRGGACPQSRVCCRNKCGYGECVDAAVEQQPAQQQKEKLFWELYAKNTIHQFEKNGVL